MNKAMLKLLRKTIPIRIKHRRGRTNGEAELTLNAAKRLVQCCDLRVRNSRNEEARSPVRGIKPAASKLLPAPDRRAGFGSGGPA